jgi:hypothetical protein
MRINQSAHREIPATQGSQKGDFNNRPPSDLLSRLSNPETQGNATISGNTHALRSKRFS